MKLTESQLRRIIKEEAQRVLNESLMGDMYMSADEAAEFISSMDPDEIAEHDIIDEDTGEVYINAGDDYRSSNLHPDNKAAEKESQDQEDFFPDEDLYPEEHRDDLNTMIKEFAAQYTDYVEETSGDDFSVSPEDAAPDLADNFFWEHPEWKDAARALGLTKQTVKEIVTDEIYDAMLKGARK